MTAILELQDLRALGDCFATIAVRSAGCEIKGADMGENKSSADLLYFRCAELTAIHTAEDSVVVYAFWHWRSPFAIEKGILGQVSVLRAGCPRIFAFQK